METGLDVQTHKSASLRDRQVEQTRKRKLVTRRFFIERPETTDKSYSGDNRLVRSESSYRRPRSAPRCRLTLARGCRRSQAFGCSPIKRVRELGSDRQTNPSRVTKHGGARSQDRAEKSTHIGEVLEHSDLGAMDNTEGSPPQ